MSQLHALLAVADGGQRDLGMRGMWLVVILLSASLVALVAGGLTWFTKRQPPAAGPSAVIDSRSVAAAMLYAGVAFGGTITVLLGICYFLMR